MLKVSHKQAVIDALPGTLGEIMAKAGVKKETAIRWLRILRDAHECYVKRWRRPKAQGPLMRVYAAGKGRNAERPKRLSMAVYKKRYRERHPIEVDIYNARRRAKTHADKVARTPQNWLSALMGAV